MLIRSLDLSATSSGAILTATQEWSAGATAGRVLCRESIHRIGATTACCVKHHDRRPADRPLAAGRWPLAAGRWRDGGRTARRWTLDAKSASAPRCRSRRQAGAARSGRGAAGLDDKERPRETAVSIRSGSGDRMRPPVATAGRRRHGQQASLAVAFSAERAPCREAGSLSFRTSCSSAPPTSTDCSVPDGAVVSPARARQRASAQVHA
jgi:hypothetical protein